MDKLRHDLEQLRNKQGFICDMDGVIYHGNRMIDGAVQFVNWLFENNKKFLFLTNSSERSPRELAEKLERIGLSISPDHFYTSALATASFLSSQTPGGSVYVIGEPGLVNALYEAGFSMNDVNPDYVVFGETRSLSYEKMVLAVRLIQKGAKLVATNSDLTCPSDTGVLPACRALVSPIEMTTGKQAYYVGKPNPLMMRHALKRLGCHYTDAVIIGDRMDTDIIAGLESELDTVLVLTGVTNLDNIGTFSFSPKYILNHVGEIAGDTIPGA
ncbi:MAG: HAD-IIA family hydrolase [Eubacteriales bacterium]